MSSTNLYVNQILVAVPAAAPELSARKLELDRMTEADPEVMTELYEVLAAEFAEIKYSMMAEACQRRAAQWRNMKGGDNGNP